MIVSEELKEWMREEIQILQKDSFNQGYMVCINSIIDSLKIAPEDFFDKEKVLCFLDLVLRKGQ